MKNQVLSYFTSLFDGIGNASALLANEQFLVNKDIVKDKFDKLGTFIEYEKLLDEINGNLYNLSQSNKEIYLLNILKGFKYSKYLNIELDSKEEQKKGLKTVVNRIDAAHNCIKKYWIENKIDENNVPAMYIVFCWEKFSSFMQKLDSLFLSHNIDFIDIQSKSNIDIWYRVKYGIIQNKEPQLSNTKTTKIQPVSNPKALEGKYKIIKGKPNYLEKYLDDISKYFNDIKKIGKQDVAAIALILYEKQLFDKCNTYKSVLLCCCEYWGCTPPSVQKPSTYKDLKKEYETKYSIFNDNPKDTN